MGSSCSVSRSPHRLAAKWQQGSTGTTSLAPVGEMADPPFKEQTDASSTKSVPDIFNLDAVSSPPIIQQGPAGPPSLLAPARDGQATAVDPSGVTHSHPPPRFHEITELVKEIFHTPMSAVVLTHQQFERSGVGHPGGDDDGAAVCHWALDPRQSSLLIVENAAEDARFQTSPQVAAGIRFYAGAPLVPSDGGCPYGTLCTADIRPRSFPPEQQEMLRGLAAVCARELEQEQLLLLERHAAEQRLFRALDSLPEGIALLDISSAGWHVVHANDAFWEAAGALHPHPDEHALPSSEGGGCHQAGSRSPIFWALFGHVTDGGRDSNQAAMAAMAAGEAFVLYVQPFGSAPNSAGQQPVLRILFKPAASDPPEAHRPAACVKALTKGGEAGAPLPGRSDGGNGGDALAAAPAHQPGPQAALHYFAVIQASQRQPPAAPSPTHTGPLLSAGSSLVGGGRQPSADGSLLGSGESSLLSSATSALKQELYSAESAGVLPSFFAMRPEVMNEVQLGPLIGSGSAGRCYRASWEGGRVAVKIIDCRVDGEASSDGTLSPATSAGLHSDGVLGSQKPAAEAALVEALVARSLAHPHIISTYAHAVSRKQMHCSGEWHQQVWIVQEFCSRGSLQGALDKGLLKLPSGGLNLPAVLMAAQEIAGACLYLHKRGIVHGDLTPGNVLLTSSSRDTRRWTCKVGDFGLSQIIHPEAHEIQGSCFGTLTHAAPELVKDGILTRAADVYSFGVILLEMTQGRRAWKGMGFMQILSAVSAGTQPFVIPDGIPEGLTSLLKRCLSHDPSERPTFEAILGEVQELLRQLPRAGDGQPQRDPVSVRGPSAEQAASKVSPFAAAAARADSSHLSTIYEPLTVC